jgi:hypothetical protein
MLSFDTCCTLWLTVNSHLHHIAGDLRSTITTKTEEIMVRRWQQGSAKTYDSKQGNVVREHEGPTLRQIRNVRKSGNARLLTFLLKAVTQQLSTADNQVWGADRTIEALQCPLCSHRQDGLHPFICKGNTAGLGRAYSAVTERLDDLCAWIVSTTPLKEWHRAQLQSPQFRQSLSVLRIPAPPLLCLTRHYAEYLGILDLDFAERLLPPNSTRCTPLQKKRLAKELPTKVTDLQIFMLQCALSSYSSWETECAASALSAAKVKVRAVDKRRAPGAPPPRPKARVAGAHRTRAFVPGPGKVVGPHYHCPCGGKVMAKRPAIMAHNRTARHIAHFSITAPSSPTPVTAPGRRPKRRRVTTPEASPRE